MPHQCVKCDNFYGDGAEELLKGCPCGGKLFFYVKDSMLKKQKKITQDLTKKDRKQIEKDVFDLVGDEANSKEPVILEMESINISKPGKYEIDLVHIFKGNPLIYKVEEGKYMIDLPNTFLLNKEK